MRSLATIALTALRYAFYWKAQAERYQRALAVVSTLIACSGYDPSRCYDRASREEYLKGLLR